MPELLAKYKLQTPEPSEILSGLLLNEGRKNIKFFAEYFLGIHLNPFQERYLLGTTQPELSLQNLIITGNQVGKTLALAVLHLWFNFYKILLEGEPEGISQSYFTTLNISPISRQSRECFRYINEILTSSFSWSEDKKRFVNKCKIEYFFKSKNENMGRIEFSNGSNFFSLSTGEDKGAGLQGAQFALITYDECVQGYHLREELPARIYSRTAKYNGRIDLISTPDEQANSQQYWFHLYSEALKGGKEWKLFTGLYDENIFILEKSREEFKKRLKIMSPEKYEQVIHGKFIVSEVNMFSPEMIEGLWIYKIKPPTPQEERQYALVADWGIAEQGDETVMLIGDITDLNNIEIVYGYSKRGGDPVELMAMASFLKQEWNDADFVSDIGGMGGIIIKKMLIKLKPISFGKEHKSDALFYLQVRLRNNLRKNLTKGGTIDENGRVKSLYLSKLENQLSAYKISDEKLDTDWVMALAMLVWFVDKRKRGGKMRSFPLRLG